MEETSDTLIDDFVESTIRTLTKNKEWAEQAIAQLDERQLRTSLDPETNSIFVIMKHIAGNLLSRWTDFLTTDGEKEWRNRDDEFVDTFANKDEALEYWNQGWSCLIESLQSLRQEDFYKTVTIRGEAHSIPLAIQRSITHTIYHVGQIMMIARILAGENWQVITIPRGKSTQYNSDVWGKGHYRSK